MKTTTCKACGNPIVWIRTTKGKSMPCDANPVAYKEEHGGKRENRYPERRSNQWNI